MNIEAAAKAVFLAGLPTGRDGSLSEGHTRWEDLGPETQARYQRMAVAAIESFALTRLENP